MNRILTLTAATALAALSFSSFAAGQHAGGHASAGSAIGEPGQAARVTRTIKVDMADTMRFTPQRITVRRGETIRFALTNSGDFKHEFSLGTDADLKEHYEAMKKFPDMEHDEPGKLNLAPGGQGEIIWRFTRAGRVSFACLHPGHYDAGMKGQITVSRK